MFKAFINDLISRSSKASSQGGVKCNDFVGIAETPDGLHEQIEKALEYTGNLRAVTNVNKSAILVCNEDNKNPVEFKWKWGEEELPIVDQYTYLGLEI